MLNPNDGLYVLPKLRVPYKEADAILPRKGI